MSRTCLPITYLMAGRPVAGETLFSEVGAAVLVFTSCSAELGIELRSAYLDGAEGEILLAESAVLPGGSTELRSRRLEGGEGVLTYQRRRLLYEHLQALQDLAGQADLGLAFDDVAASAALLDPHSPFASRS